jgi:ribonuclease HI
LTSGKYNWLRTVMGEGRFISLKELILSLLFSYSYIERARNSRADSLANEAMDNRSSSHQTLPIWQSVSDLVKGD